MDMFYFRRNRGRGTVALLFLVTATAGCNEKPPSTAAHTPTVAPETDSSPSAQAAPSVVEKVEDAATAPAETFGMLVPQISPALMDLPLPSPHRFIDGALSVRWGEDSQVSGSLGVVTSVENHASEAGMKILKDGGNAVDAAVAVALALAVTHPSAGNIGGGGFLLAKVGTRIEAIDFREDAPANLSDKVFWSMVQKGAKGPQSVGIPGTIDGLYLAHQRNGKLPWAAVVAPAIALAEHGYTLGVRQAQTLIWAQAQFKLDPTARAIFYNTKPQLGGKIVQPQLAKALSRIAEQGRQGFYEGETAQDIVASLGAQALITLEDLKNYRAKVREPLFFDFYDFRVITMPAPSAGGVAVAQNLLMLQRLDVKSTKKDSALRFHLIAETSRRSQVERQFFVVAPDHLSAEEQAAQRARALDPGTWLTDHPVSPGWVTQSKSLHHSYKRALSELPHTTHLSVIDKEGNAVSCTVTLSGSFGARLMTKETGIVLNNSVASFSSMGQNTPAAGQRTTSSMAPTLAFLGPDHFLVLGSPGGNTIPNTITQTFLRLALDDDNLARAVKQPRIHQGFVPQHLQMERYAPLSAGVQQRLRALGHEIKFERNVMGDANIAAYMNGHMIAVADAREGGLALATPETSEGSMVAATPPDSAH